jgi:hypothetical protein
MLEKQASITITMSMYDDKGILVFLLAEPDDVALANDINDI